MKKIKIAVILLFFLVFTACTKGQYKRIVLQTPGLGEDENQRFDVFTKVENAAKEEFDEIMPVYRISPRLISTDELIEFADRFYLQGMKPDIWENGSVYISKPTVNDMGIDGYSVFMNQNEISWDYHPAWNGDPASAKSNGFSMSDEDLEKDAWQTLRKIPFLTGEYEYLGISSTQIANTDSGNIVTMVRVSFRRLVDGIRVIGNDICDFYYGEKGLCMMRIYLYDYEKIGEIEMMSLKDAVSRIKKPDGFSVENKSEGYGGKADAMKIERVKLLFVNQYLEGCEILQPVFNLIGTMTNETGSADFSSRIIAIPEKYTHN